MVLKMNEEEIIRILLPWNFWDKKIPVGIKREGYTNEAAKHLKTNKIATLTGIRRSGKSFIAKQVVDGLVKDKRNSLIVNFEEARFPWPLDKDILISIYDAYLSLIKPDKKPLIILDEIQEVKLWEKFARTLQEQHKADLVVTGSSAKIMSEELATLLTGRTLHQEVFPLDFGEFLLFREISIGNRLDIIKQEPTIRSLFREYCSFGGFPEIALEQDKDIKLKILESYYQDIIHKDIVRRFNVRRIEKLEQIAFYYLTNFSSPITFTRIGKYLKFEEKSVEIFSKYLEVSKLFFFVKRFSSSIKEKENSPRKLYLMDAGLHHLSNALLSDKNSKIFENIIAMHLFHKEGKNLCYWKDNLGREVDFVLGKGGKVTALIQSSWSIENPATKEREVMPLIKASEELHCNNLVILTENEEGNEISAGRKIKVMPAWKFLLQTQTFK